MMQLFDGVRNFLKPKAPTKEQSFTWKYIDLEPELVEEIQLICKRELKQDLDAYNFFQWLPVQLPDIKGVRVHKAALVVCQGNEVPKFSHKDPCSPDPNRPGKHRDWGPIVLNVPLLNCENSITRMYKEVKNPMHHMTVYNEPTVIMPVKECEPLTSFVLNKPVLFNTQVLHAVFNHSNQPRFAVSLRFKENPLDWIDPI
jgi:hypothetical protein